MGVKVIQATPPEDTAMGRRLFPMLGSWVGGAYGGTGGAAAGGALGSKLGGGSNEDALMAGVGAARDKPGEKKKGDEIAPATQTAESVLKPAAQPVPSLSPQIAQNDNPFDRRFQAKQQDPGIVINEGLNALSQMPDELKNQYAPTLIQAQMSLEQKRRGRA